MPVPPKRLQTQTYADVVAAGPVSPSTPYVECNKRHSAILPGTQILDLVRANDDDTYFVQSRLPYFIAEEEDYCQLNADSSPHAEPPQPDAMNGLPGFARRAPKPKFSVTYQSTALQRAGEVHTLQGGYSAEIGPFFPGTIIRVPHFEQHGTTSYPWDWKNKLLTHDYGDICVKWRRMVVVTAHKGHHVCLPINTFNGRGVGPETCGNHKELADFVPIFDYRVGRSDCSTTPHEGLETKFFKDNVKPLLAGAVVCLTYPISRRNDCTAIVEGKLKLASTRQLLSLYIMQTTKSIELWLNDLMQSVTESGMTYADRRDEEDLFTG
jgi:hypothetical protein